MGKRSRKKQRQKLNASRKEQRKLKKILEPGVLYVNMNSNVWKTGMLDGVNIKKHCIGYCLPSDFKLEENKILERWKAWDKRSKMFRISEVKLELVGTEL